MGKSEVRKKLNKGFFLDPTYDTSFRYLFTGQGGIFLKSFLSAVLKEEIIDLVILNPLVPTSIEETAKHEGKSGASKAVDIRCRANQKEIILEMQRKYEEYYLARLQYYAAKVIADETTIVGSENYHSDIKDLYVITISNTSVFEKGELISHYKRKFNLSDSQTNDILPTNKVNYIFYNLEKFKEQHDKNYPFTSPAKKWLNFLARSIEYKTAPYDVSEDEVDQIITQGYEHMKIVKISTGENSSVWNAMQKEMNEKMSQELLEQKYKSLEEKSNIKDYISEFKDTIRLKYDNLFDKEKKAKLKEKLEQKFLFLSQKRLPDHDDSLFQECWNYFKKGEHVDESDITSIKTLGVAQADHFDDIA